MTTQRVFALVLMVIGAILLVMGLNASDSMADQMSNMFTGRVTDTTTWYLVGGAAALIVGLVLVVYPSRRKLT